MPRGFHPLHPLLRIDAQDQADRDFFAVCQLHHHIGDFARVALGTHFVALQELQDRADRRFILRQKFRRLLSCAPCPIGPNAARLQSAYLDAERCDFHRESVAKAADSPLRRVVRRIAGNRQAASDGRHLKDVAALLFAHHRDSGAGGVHNAVEASIHHCLKVFRTHLLERRKLSETGIIDEDIQPPEALDR